MSLRSGPVPPLRVSSDKFILWEFLTTLANAIVAGNYLDGDTEEIVAARFYHVKIMPVRRRGCIPHTG